MANEPRPFTLAVPDAEIDDLRARRSKARFPDQAPGEPWAYGSDLATLRDLCRWPEMPGVGHFAALQHQEALSRGITELFRPLRRGAAA